MCTWLKWETFLFLRFDLRFHVAPDAITYVCACVSRSICINDVNRFRTTPLQASESNSSHSYSLKSFTLEEEKNEEIFHVFLCLLLQKNSFGEQLTYSAGVAAGTGREKKLHIFKFLLKQKRMKGGTSEISIYFHLREKKKWENRARKSHWSRIARCDARACTNYVKSRSFQVELSLLPFQNNLVSLLF